MENHQFLEEKLPKTESHEKMEAGSTIILPFVCKIKFAKVSKKIFSRLVQWKEKSQQKIHGIVGDGSTQILWSKTSQLAVIDLKQHFQVQIKKLIITVLLKHVLV